MHAIFGVTAVMDRKEIEKYVFHVHRRVGEKKIINDESQMRRGEDH